MISLGIICYQGHSSAACLIKDGQILSAVAEERFSRLKNDDSFPAQAIDYILNEFKMTFNEIDHVGFAWSPSLTLKGQLKNLKISSYQFIFGIREGGIKRSRLSKFFLILGVKNEIKKRYHYCGKFSYLDHHYCHALSAYLQTQKDDCVVMVADGMGEHRSTSIYEFNGIDHKLIYKDIFPNSLGIFYSAGTQFLKFKPDSDEFKIMGLAAYGKSEKYREHFKKIYRFKNNNFELNSEFIEIDKSSNQFYSKKYSELFYDCNSFQDRADFALALQRALEEIIFKILKNNSYKFKSKNFATSGGVFLNCLMNQKIRDSKLFDSCDFFPVADDNGTSIGAAQAVQLSDDNFKRLHFDNLYLGPEIKFERQNFDFEKLEFKKIENLKDVAEFIADGKVIAFASGRMEFGHRALGARSIVADPRRKEMKDIVNQKIKFREEYRPFAPSVLEDKVEQFFECNKNNVFPYMIETLNAKENTRELAPAIVHEDGTSRVQTVIKKHNPEYNDLILEFYKLTGCPMVLNTSFNLNGMPIVNSFKDAIDCFCKTELDYLYIDGYLIWKKIIS